MLPNDSVCWALAQQTLSNTQRQVEIKRRKKNTQQQQQRGGGKKQNETREEKKKKKYLARGRLYILYPQWWQAAQTGGAPSPPYNKHRQTDRGTDRQTGRDRQTARREEEAAAAAASETLNIHDALRISKSFSTLSLHLPNIPPPLKRAEGWWRRRGRGRGTGVWELRLRVLGLGEVSSLQSERERHDNKKWKGRRGRQPEKSLESQTVEVEKKKKKRSATTKRDNKNYQRRAVSSLTVARLDRSACLAFYARPKRLWIHTDVCNQCRLMSGANAAPLGKSKKAKKKKKKERRESLCTCLPL